MAKFGKLKKLLSIVLAVSLCMSMVSMVSFADNEEDAPQEISEIAEDNPTTSQEDPTNEKPPVEPTEPAATDLTVDPEQEDEPQDEEPGTTEPQDEDEPGASEISEKVQAYLDAVAALEGKEPADEDMANLLAACEAAYALLSEEEQAQDKVAEAQDAYEAAKQAYDDAQKQNPEPEQTNTAKIGDETYATLQGAIDSIQANQEDVTVTLLKDTTESVTVTNKNITLDLAGHTLTGDGKGYGTVLTINGGSLTLKGDGTITGGNVTGATAMYGGGVTVMGDASFTMENGTISGNEASQYGGGVFVYNGTFTMNGGTISDNKAEKTGGGVSVYDYFENISSTFTMNGGTISGNTASGGGGIGVMGYRQDGEHKALIINGGIIEHNDAIVQGGGLTVQYAQYKDNQIKGSASISGATIRNNTAGKDGGGLYSYDAILDFSGNTITGNTAVYRGGGLYLLSEVKATSKDDVITGNTAVQGGGVYVYGGDAISADDTSSFALTTFTMTGGKLYGNDSSSEPSNSADVYSYKATLLLPAAASMEEFEGNNRITGWFWDGGGQYAWGESYSVKRDVENGTTAQQALKAAYGYYTLTYTWDGGSEEVPDAVKVAEGAPVPLPPVSSNSNWTFNNWTMPNGETVTENSIMPAEDLTITGHWTATNSGGGGGGGGGTSTPTTYSVTVNYVDEEGNTIQSSETTDGYSRNSTYTVTIPEIDGYTYDHAEGALSGTITGSVTVTLVYAADTADLPEEEPPLSDEPTTDIPDENPPLADEPTTDIPDEEPPLADAPTTDIPDENPPLADAPQANVPKTGDVSLFWIMTAALSAAGLVWLSTGKRKEEQ